jgi:hypothetical protein
MEKPRPPSSRRSACDCSVPSMTRRPAKSRMPDYEKRNSLKLSTSSASVRKSKKQPRQRRCVGVKSSWRKPHVWRRSGRWLKRKQHASEPWRPRASRASAKSASARRPKLKLRGSIKSAWTASSTKSGKPRRVLGGARSSCRSVRLCSKRRHGFSSSVSKQPRTRRPRPLRLPPRSLHLLRLPDHHSQSPHLQS